MQLTAAAAKQQLASIPYQEGLIVRPRRPRLPGVLGVPPDTCVVAHGGHEAIAEHLHTHFEHMHICYGFEMPPPGRLEFDSVALEVAMMIRAEHRVDCNPMFVARGKGNEGTCLRIGGEDVHWVRNDDVGEKASRFYEATGRTIPNGFYFSGFYTSDVGEREIRRYESQELRRVIGQGLGVDQHFQATWREPREQAIEPYDVIIYLGDDQTSYLTFFRLPVVVPIAAD